jgi:hypothetical protein
MTRMKQSPLKILFFTFLLVVGIFSCKKEDSDKKEPLLSKVIYNGLNGYKLYYNEKNLWTKWELFNVDPADNSLTAYITMEYNDKDQLSKLSSYSMPGDIPSQRLFFEYDNSGKQTGYTAYDLQGANPSKPSLKGTFAYNQQNQLSTVTIKKDNGDLYGYYTLTYYPNGFMKERDEYDETITHQLRLTGKTIYSIPLGDNIKGWEKMAVLPLDGDELTRKPRYETVQRYIYNNGVLMKNFKESTSARENNSDGTLKRLTSTTQSITPAAADQINIFEFEYIQQ